MTIAKILIVEDEVLFAMSLRSHILRLGYDQCEFLVSGEEAIDWVDQERPDLVLMDILLQGRISGIDTAKAIRLKHDTPIIFLTGYLDTEFVAEISAIGNATLITKPLRPNDITAVIEQTLCIQYQDLPGTGQPP